MEKILLIEDEELIIRLLGKKLASIGYEITLAMDGQEGLEKMRKNRPDLILLDIIMPKKGGFEVMEEMKKDPALAKIPVIIISNSGQPLELENQKVVRKSLVARCSISSGECFTETNLTIKRPGTGKSPMDYWALLGESSNRNYDADELI